MTNREVAIKVVRQLHSAGFQTLLAGGCVRDMLLRRAAKDYDVATDAEPKDVMALFRRTLKVGAKFGVVMVLIEDKQVEVATFRSEADYTDGRHPDKVEFASSEQDALRRDFTINGMFYDPLAKTVIDYVAGQADLKKKIIRTIGRPRDRFTEDYLRMLRAVRFSAELGFEIEQATFDAIRKGAQNIKKTSGERISAELERTLISPNRAEGTAMLFETGLAEAIFPDFADNSAEFAISVLAKLPEKIDYALGMGGLFSGCETAFALDACSVLKPSRDLVKHVRFLLTNRDMLLDENMSVARLRMIAAKPYFTDLYELQRAIQRAQQKSTSALTGLKRRIKALGDIELTPEPLLDGHDLMRLGAVAGPILGQLSREMYIAQLEGKITSTSQAEQWVARWLQRHQDLDD